MIEEEEEITKPILKPLGAIFKRNFRHLKVQNLDMSATATPLKIEEKVEDKAISSDNGDASVFNSKLCWLSNTPQAIPDPSFNLPDLDFPDLSAENNQLITKMCPKVNNGHLCSLKDCKYQHPPKKEVRKIVSDMRHLKKRIVSDVLDIIESDEKKSSPKLLPQARNKPCKFQDKCKFKNTTCPYIHDNTEPGQCQFGVKCKLVVTDSEKNVVGNNTKMKKKCSFIHPNESKEVYLTRQK
jgi:hypothetical protein